MMGSMWADVLPVADRLWMAVVGVAAVVFVVFGISKLLKNRKEEN